MEKKYVISKKYLAEGIAWLGFKYYKEGYGKETKYIFTDTIKFREALTNMMRLREELKFTK